MPGDKTIVVCFHLERISFTMRPTLGCRPGKASPLVVRNCCVFRGELYPSAIDFNSNAEKQRHAIALRNKAWLRRWGAGATEFMEIPKHADRHLARVLEHFCPERRAKWRSACFYNPDNSAAPACKMRNPQLDGRVGPDAALLSAANHWSRRPSYRRAYNAKR